jgi:hypothetical protein
MILNVYTSSFTYLILALAVLGSAQAQSTSSDDVCDNVTCSNKGFCVPSTLYQAGYWCECDDGWVGQNCGHPQPTVVCGDHEIVITIDSGIVEELKLDLNEEFVYFGNFDNNPENKNENNNCHAELDNDKFKLKLQAPFSSCGTELLTDGGDDFTFSNTVVWNSEVNNTNIDRELVLLDFKCIYQDEYTTDFGDDPTGITNRNNIKFATASGSFKISMSIFEDNTFAQDKEYTESPSIGIGTYVYAQVELEEVEDQHLVVTMDECFATQTRDPEDGSSVKHFLIQDRCANNDPTVEVYQNGLNHQSRFKFQMFKWRWSADPIYLHCEVDVCNKTSEVCTGTSSNCNGKGEERKKRDLEYDGEYIHDYQGSNTVLTMGPLMVAVNDVLLDTSATDRIVQEVDTTMVYLGLSLGLVLAVLGAIVGAMLRKRRQLNRNMAEEVSSSRLTNLRFTREAF